MSQMLKGPIKNFALGIYDGPHATPKEANEGPIFLGIKNVTPEGRLDFSSIRHVAEEDLPKWTRRVTPQKDDIVFSYEATLHRYAIIPEDFRGCLGRRMALVRPNLNKVVPRFLHYYFLSSVWKARVESNIISGATVDRIPIAKFPEFEIVIPPLPTQYKIASILSTYDELIENNRRRIQLLEQAARLLYKEWFVHLRFPGHEHVKLVDGVPEGWEKGVVSDFYDTASGGTPSRKNPDFFTGEINWVKTQELADSFIFETDERITGEAIQRSSAKIFPKKTVLVAMYGATIGQTGILAEPAATNQACCAILPASESTNYIHAFLFFKENKPGLINLSQGAAQNNISQQIIRNYSMVLPKRSLMMLFAESLEPIFEQIQNLQYQNQKLKSARDLLLPKLMNGDIAV
ncbi:MAG: restriction endonuclease subunit S [bacterium]|nr:restriction endonuclease subunit S [bacterium]